MTDDLREANKARADELRSDLAERRARCIHEDDDAMVRWSRNMPKKAPPLTAEEIDERVDHRTDAALTRHAKSWAEFVKREIADELAKHAENTDAGVGEAMTEERRRWRAELDKLRSEHDLRISALLAEIEKLQRGLGDDHGDNVETLERRRHA